MSLSNIIFLQLLDALHLTHSPPSCELPMTSLEAEEYWVEAFRNAPLEDETFTQVFKPPSDYCNVHYSITKSTDVLRRFQAINNTGTKEEEVQKLFNEIMPLVCESSTNVLYMFRNTSMHNAAAKNYKVDCSFVEKKSTAANSGVQVTFHDLVLIGELKKPNTLNHKQNITQLVDRVIALIKIQHRQFAYIMRSDEQRITFYKFFANGRIIRSSDFNFLSIGPDNKLNFGDGFNLLLGLLCTGPELLGYRPLMVYPISEATLLELHCEKSNTSHLYTGIFSEIFAVDHSKILKCYNLTLYKNQYDREIEVLALCKEKCEALAQIVAHFEDKDDKVGYLLKTPFATSTLELENYSFPTFCLVVKSVLSAFQFLHDNNILHGDVSPSNILLYNENTTCKCVLNDYGLSRKIEPSTVFDAFFGTLPYCSHRWYTCIAEKSPIKAHFMLDYENLFYVLLWFAAISGVRMTKQRFPWDGHSVQLNALQVKLSYFNTRQTMTDVIKSRTHTQCIEFLTSFYNLCRHSNSDNDTAAMTSIIKLMTSIG